MLTTENLRFARQLSCEAVVVHMADYHEGLVPRSAFDADAKMWDVSGARGRIWTVAELRGIREKVEAEGLTLAALENLNPALWHDVLLDGPERDSQLDGLKELVRRLGEAGIPCLGYNFTLAGVWGTKRGPLARGGASSVEFRGDDPVVQEPIPNGAVWNRHYDPSAAPGRVPAISREELLSRHERFLEAVLPVAGESGVVLAAHPDDPPLERVRDTPRFMHREHHLSELTSRFPSPALKLEFCAGTIAEMPGADVYRAAARHAAENRIAYIHFRNVKGQVPVYRETFVDEGDIDMLRLLSVLHRNNYRGVLIPDHTPYVTCDAPWHAGMAFALGYMRAAIVAVETEPRLETSCVTY